MILNQEVAITRPSNAAAAGATDVNGTAVDMAGYDGVLFIAALGTLTATQVTTLKAQQGDQSDGSDAADISGAVTAAAADADSNKLLVLDVAKSLITKRYVRPVLDRGTANAVLDGIVALRYQGKALAVTQNHSTISQSKNAL